MEELHEGLLRKFHFLKGELIIGKSGIKGAGSSKKLPPDEFVNFPHILHDLIRGFYKPAGKPYLLSYQATESEKNYGKQIIWKDDGETFSKINMHPPRGEKDNRKISDVKAARYNLENGIPFGILHKVAKGQNKILGLGKIIKEESDGVFIVEPFEIQADFIKETILIEKRFEENMNTDILRNVVLRRGQNQFKRKLLQKTQKCAICDLNDVRFLLASHIKPWRLSSHLERMDVNNGLLLCPNHDKLFDTGYITFSFNGELMISSELKKDVQKNMLINENLKISFTPPMQKYLKWHRDNFFKK